MKTLNDFDITDKLVLLRIDINSPVIDGKVEDNPRIREASNTIKELLKRKSKIAIIAHQGRKGDSDFIDLKQHSKLLSKHSTHSINYVDDLFGENAQKSIANLKSGQAILLKNVREFEDEIDCNKKNNRYTELSNLFDFYINDAFSVSHRNQGSIIIPPKNLISLIGPSFEKELLALEKFSFKKHAKNIFLLGGAKVEDYLPLFNVLENKNSKILASGVLASIIFASQGSNLGYENLWLDKQGYSNLMPKIKSLYEKYENQIILPIDFATGNPDGKSKRKEIDALDFPSNEKIWDVGHETVELFKEEMKGAKTIFMKGPLGFSEMSEYKYSTVEILKEISKLSKKGSFTLLGGGHLTSTIDSNHIKNNFSHISLSGGALISYLSGNKLPGIKAIEESQKSTYH